MNATEERQYSELLREKRPHVIRTEAENEEALREIEALLARGDAIAPAESELLELLTLLVERFEEEHYATTRATSREILQELMSAHGVTQKDVAKLFPSKGIASEVLSGKRSINNAQAQKLAEHFHVSPVVFVNL